MLGLKGLKIEVVDGVTEGITYSGERHRRKTVLLRVGRHSISKKAFQLGVILSIFQVLDGLLTYIGVSLYGVNMEGNQFLHVLMESYGARPALVVTKLVAVAIVVMLTGYAHKRKWIRPLIAALCVGYLVFAVWPWAYIIANHYSQ